MTEKHEQFEKQPLIFGQLSCGMPGLNARWTPSDMHQECFSTQKWDTDWDLNRRVPGTSDFPIFNEDKTPLSDIIKTAIEKAVITKTALDPEPAHTFLEEAVTTMKARAALRDKVEEGERSMATIVRVFNALTGLELTEAEGWSFMIILKMVRGQQGSYNRDDYVDMGAYAALLGECESSNAARRKT